MKDQKEEKEREEEEKKEGSETGSGRKNVTRITQQIHGGTRSSAQAHEPCFMIRADHFLGPTAAFFFSRFWDLMLLLFTNAIISPPQDANSPLKPKIEVTHSRG